MADGVRERFLTDAEQAEGHIVTERVEPVGRAELHVDLVVLCDALTVTLQGRRQACVLEQLIDAGDCAAVALVKEEIDSVGTPNLQTWAKGHAGLFVPLATDIQLAAASIEACYPDLLDPKSPYQSAEPMSSLSHRSGTV